MSSKRTTKNTKKTTKTTNLTFYGFACFVIPFVNFVVSLLAAMTHCHLGRGRPDVARGIGTLDGDRVGAPGSAAGAFRSQPYRGGTVDDPIHHRVAVAAAVGGFAAR